MDAVKTENLTKYYGKARGINNVNLSIKEGDFFGFIGPNGAGKSTTVRTLLGLIYPSSGRAEVFGLDSARDKLEILSRIGYLPSEISLYNGMKVKEIIELSANLRKTDCKKEAALLCDMLELDTSKKIGELSLGNRKKVGIVCALQHKPELYILDEPTSGLDPLMQREFFSLLKERNEAGATVFLSSHILSEIEKYCKTAAVIRDGCVVACDKVSNLGHKGAKRVCLRGITQMPEIEGATNIKNNHDSVTFLYVGTPAQLLTSLSALKFDDFTITDPDLEEVFMHYYSKEEN